MPECPYCGKWFKTKRGLNQHIAKSHETKFGGVRVLDPMTIDPLGAAERRAERKKKKRKGSGFW